VGHSVPTHRDKEEEEEVVLWMRGDGELRSTTRPRCAYPSKIDRVRCLLHIAEELSHHRNRDDGYFPISSREVAKAIGQDHTGWAFEEVLVTGILETDGRSVPDKKCRWYRYSQRALGLPLERVVISGQVASRLKAHRVDRIRATISCDPVHEFLWNSLGKLTLNAPGHLDRENGLANTPAGIAYANMTIDRLTRRDFFFSHDRRTGRVFNTFTNMPKTLRKHALLDGRPLVEIDVKNSQPVLLKTFSPDAGSERESFIATVRGGAFYEVVNAASDKPLPEADRELIKERIFSQVLFGPINPHFPMWKAFSRLFPALANEVIRQKAKSWNAFPLELQRREAAIMIGQVTPSLIKELEGVPFLTIHDSIAVPAEFADIVAATIKREFLRVVGFEPSLRISGVGA
jgi:hypothetical protein